MARLKVKYTEEVAPALFKKFGYKSTMQIPKIDKVGVNTSYVFYVHPDEIEAITREFAAIGNNLNQIAAFFNSGGIQSRAMHENINHAIACTMF